MDFPGFSRFSPWFPRFSPVFSRPNRPHHRFAARPDRGGEPQGRADCQEKKFAEVDQRLVFGSKRKPLGTTGFGLFFPFLTHSHLTVLKKKTLVSLAPIVFFLFF